MNRIHKQTVKDHALRFHPTGLNNWDLTTYATINLLANFMPILLRMPTSLLPLGVLLKTRILVTASFVVEGTHGSSEPISFSLIDVGRDPSACHRLLSLVSTGRFSASSKEEEALLKVLPTSNARSAALNCNKSHGPHLEHIDLGQLLLSQQQGSIIGKLMRNLQVLRPDELKRLQRRVIWQILAGTHMNPDLEGPLSAWPPDKQYACPNLSDMSKLG
eukprot:1161218-Pelagomonas_calceolata.AAC.7